MHKLLFVTTSKDIPTQDIVTHTADILGQVVTFQTTSSKEELYDLIVENNGCIAIIVDEFSENNFHIINELKNEEEFCYLPVILLSSKCRLETEELQKADTIINLTYSAKEIALQIASFIKYKLRIDNLQHKFSEMSELNAKKSIQLDLIKKFIPLTVWDTCEKLAENQHMVIEEEEKEISIIYADLESFTTMSENMTPSEIINTLNLLFDIITQIVYQNFGDVDKFIGDAFLAVFDSPDMAVLTALMIQSELEEINKKRHASSLPRLNFRLGLHHGKVIRGSVGGTLRFDNTLIGDPINTAQRLEGMSPPGGILASKEILGRINSVNFATIRYDNYFLKGKFKQIEAALLYDYYKSHKDILPILFKQRKQHEKSGEDT